MELIEFDTMYGTGGAIFTIMFIVVIGVMIVAAVRGLKTWNDNNHSPKLTVDALIVAKRTQVSHAPGSEGNAGHTTTQYYVTFQVESGDRMEFRVSGMEYGMLAEGDRGWLTFQGTRYLSFERD